jgi:hypothetical protein
MSRSPSCGCAVFCSANDYHSLASDMGLDAVVYRSKASLPFDPDAVGAVVDKSTGEYYVSDPMLEREFERRFPRETRIASQKRIGNIALVAELRDCTSQILEDRSVILSKVLYSGTHSGDSIPVELASALEDELFRLQHYAERANSDYLGQFVTDMLELVEAARREGNPIVF